ncbi:MAG: heme-binding protein, partial [Pirellulaceae bacterium]
DQEGHWMPKNRINHVEVGRRYYGNFFGYHDVTDSSDDLMEQPLVWITNAVDRSPAQLLWVDREAWGPLQGSLLSISYGYGKLYVIPYEEIEGELQGGICELPMAPFPTGIMRGRFHPLDRQLYTCGMFAWASNQQQPGGFYRVRYTGRPVHLPVELHAMADGIAITFSGELDPRTVADVSRFSVKTWTLKRTASYGSDHYNERPSEIRSARLSQDRRTVYLQVPGIRPTWCMEIKYSLTTAAGANVKGMIHNTIHRLPSG